MERVPVTNIKKNQNYIVLCFFNVYFGPVLVDGFTESDMAVRARERPWRNLSFFFWGSWGRAERLYGCLSVVGCLWLH